MGWFGILSTVPLVTICTWHRSLLFVVGFINAAAPALRYHAAVTKNYPVMVVSSFAVGSVYGVIGAWPPLLARLLFPSSPNRWTLVTAVASLANYLGGAVGTTLLPAVINNADDLLHVLELQVWGSCACAALPWHDCGCKATLRLRLLLPCAFHARAHTRAAAAIAAMSPTAGLICWCVVLLDLPS